MSPAGKSPEPLMWVAMIPLLFSVACGGEESSADAPIVVWDTASVPRLIISQQAAAESPRWSLGTSPALEIGQAVGDESRTFGRITGVLVLQGGRIVVADAQANGLRFFDDRGRLEGTAGRAGDGPGEFRGLRWLGECARDSVFAYDFVHDRVSVFSATGAFSRSFYIELSRPPPLYRLSCSQEGLFVTLAWPPEDEVPRGPYETVAPMSLADASGRMISVLGDFPGEERVAVPSMWAPRVFGQKILIGVSGDAVYVGVSGRYRIAILSTSGVPRAVFGIDLPALPVTELNIERSTEQEIKNRRVSGEAARRLARDIREQVPEYFPMFDRLLVASNGDIWVRRYARPTDDVHHWDIFSGAGTYRGFLGVPGAFEPINVDERAVAGRWRGVLDDESVRVYQLEIPSGAEARR